MGRLLNTFRRSMRWQIGAAATTLLTVAAIFAAVALASSGPETTKVTLEEGQELVTVRYGTFAREIPVGGSLVFPNRQSLTFDSRGVVGDILVAEGQRVEEGQILATFNKLALAGLQRTVASEELDLESSQRQMNTLLIPNPVSIAEAEANVASAAVSEDDARQILEDLIESDSLSVALAEQAAANAEKALDDAREALEDLLDPKEIDISSTEKRVAAAKVEVDNAQEAYDDIKDGSFPPEVVRDAQNRAAFAVTNLANARTNLKNVQFESDNNLRQVRDAFDEASEQYLDLFRYWLGVEPTDEELALEPEALFETWGLDLDFQFDRNANRLYATAKPLPDNPDTRWRETTIWAWLNLYPGYRSIQGTCEENELLGPSERCVEREFNDLFEVYDAARDDFETVEENARKAIDSAQDAVTAAEDEVADSEDDLEDILDGPDDSEIEDAEKRLRLARASLEEEEEDLEELVTAIDPLDVAQAEKNLSVARANFEEAKEDMDRAINNALDIEQARKQLALAEANLDQANVSLENASNIHARQLALAEADVNLAQAALDDAVEDMEGAIVRAPFDGVVSLINVEVDDEVDDESRVVEVVDPTVVAVDGVIDAANKSFVQTGSRALVTIQALQGQPLEGVVASVASEPRTERGVVSYAVRIRVDVPPNVEIPVGLTGVSTTIVSEETGVITVPRDAVARRATDSQPVVLVMRDGEIVEQPVLLGDSNDDWTMVRSGLEAGDQLVVDSAAPDDRSVQLSRR